MRFNENPIKHYRTENKWTLRGEPSAGDTQAVEARYAKIRFNHD